LFIAFAFRGLYNGSVAIWNYETGQLVRSFEVTDVPVRAIAFIARKSWFVTGELFLLLPFELLSKSVAYELRVYGHV